MIFPKIFPKNRFFPNERSERMNYVCSPDYPPATTGFANRSGIVDIPDKPWPGLLHEVGIGFFPMPDVPGMT